MLLNVFTILSSSSALRTVRWFFCQPFRCAKLVSVNEYASFVIWLLNFYEHKWQTIYKQGYVRAEFVRAVDAWHFCSTRPIVILRVVIVDELNAAFG